MKTALTLTVLLSLVTSASALAQSTRLLVCSSNDEKITIGICGIRPCEMTVENEDGEETYLLKRTKQANGALVYKPANNETKKCTIKIGALQQGVRRITNKPRCAKTLKNRPCNFVDVSDS